MFKSLHGNDCPHLEPVSYAFGPVQGGGDQDSCSIEVLQSVLINDKPRQSSDGVCGVGTESFANGCSPASTSDHQWQVNIVDNLPKALQNEVKYATATT